MALSVASSCSQEDLMNEKDSSTCLQPLLIKSGCPGPPLRISIMQEAFQGCRKRIQVRSHHDAFVLTAINDAYRTVPSCISGLKFI